MKIKNVFLNILTISWLLSSVSAGAAEFFGKNINWNPGVSGGIPDVAVVANVLDFGAAANGSTDDAAAFQAAINSVQGNGAVYVPPGDYLIGAKLSMKQGVVLRGAGWDRTHLMINHSADAIEAITYKRGTWIPVTSGYQKGSTVLTLQDASSFLPGLFVEMQQDNEPAIMYTSSEWNQSWAQGLASQIAAVTAVEGNTITLDEPLRLEYYAARNPVIRTQGFIQFVGIEDLHIKRVDTSDTNIFFFKNAANCWIKNVVSELAAKSHVATETVYRIEVRDSFFNEATNWGGGGHGYGINLGYHSTNCLTENNIFKHLRHSMLASKGAIANVYAYNYSFENWQPEPGWTPCDISMHGHYPNHNLFESNIVQEIDFADYWGPCGPENTVFRNSVRTEDIDVLDHSNNQSVIGNEVTQGAVNIENTVISSTILNHINLIRGSLNNDPGIPNSVLPDSLYLTAKPSFYGTMPWPSLGADIPEGTIPAKERYLALFSGTTPTPPPILYGDVNGSGSTDIIDALMTAQYYVGLNPPGFNPAAGDVNQNGSVDIIDALIIAQYYVGLIAVLPV